MPEWCLRFGIVPLVNEPSLSPEQAARYAEQLCEIGLSHGIDRMGVAPANIMLRARTILHERKSLGLHDTMQFTYRNPDRSTNPSASVSGANSIIVGALSYSVDAPDTPEVLSARVARYAWSNYYEELRAALNAVRNKLQHDGWLAEVFVDSNALVDREAAYLAGIGWYGKNANLLFPGAGSFFVLGSVITNAPLPCAEQPLEDGCGACKRCLDSCPTNAIVEAGVIDATKCLAWLVQRSGVFPREFRVALGDRVYGCDACQEVCPPTIRLSITKKPNAVRAWIPILRMLELDDETLMREVAQWYVAERNAMWVRRNLLIVLGNIGNPQDESVQHTIARFCQHSEPMLRAHAVWSAARLGLHQFVPVSDSDAIVQDEIDHLPEVRSL